MTIVKAQRQQTAQAHEMSDLGAQPLTNGHEAGPTSTFLAEVSNISRRAMWTQSDRPIQVASIQDSIERINVNITNISALHARTLNITDSGRVLDTAQLDELAAETRKLINNVKDRIKTLDREPMSADAQMRRNRVRQIIVVLIRCTLMVLLLDRSYPLEIPGSYTELSKGRARVPCQVKTACRTSIKNR
jgi:hypothetical protein